MLQQGRGPGGQQSRVVGVGPGGRGVGQQGVRGQGRVGRRRGVGGAAVGQVGKGVRVHGGRDVGVRPQRPSVVAVPLLAAAAVVRGERRHLWQRRHGEKRTETEEVEEEEEEEENPQQPDGNRRLSEQLKVAGVSESKLRPQEKKKLTKKDFFFQVFR